MKSVTINRFLSGLLLCFGIIALNAQSTKTYQVKIPLFGTFTYTVDPANTTQIVGIVSKPTTIKPFAHTSLPSSMSYLKSIEMNDIRIITPPEQAKLVPGKVTLTFQGQVKIFNMTAQASFKMVQAGNSNYNIDMEVDVPHNSRIGNVIPAVAGQVLGNTNYTAAKMLITSYDHDTTVVVEQQKFVQPVKAGITIFGLVNNINIGNLEPAFEKTALSSFHISNASVVSYAPSFNDLKQNIPPTSVKGDLDLSKAGLSQISGNLSKLPSDLTLTKDGLHIDAPVPAMAIGGLGQVNKGKIVITAKPLKKPVVDISLTGEVTVNAPVIGQVKATLDSSMNSKTKKFDFVATVDSKKGIKPLANSGIPGIKDIEVNDLKVARVSEGTGYTTELQGSVTMFNTTGNATLTQHTASGSKHNIIKASFDKGLALTSAIPPVANTPLGHIALKHLTVVISPIEYEDAELGITIKKGINVIGDLDKITMKALMPNLGSTPISGAAFSDIHFVIQGMLSPKNLKDVEVNYSAHADLSNVPALKSYQNQVSNLPVKGSFGLNGTNTIKGSLKSPTGPIDLSITVKPKAPAAEKVSLKLLTRQSITMPVVGKVTFEAEINTDPKSLEMRGKAIEPVTVRPFSYISGSPAELQELEMGQLEVQAKFAPGEEKKINAKNAKLSGLIKFMNTSVEGMINPVEKADKSYDVAFKVSVPPTMTGLPKEMYEPWNVAKAIPSFAGKPMGDVVFKQLTFVFAPFEFDTTIRQFGKTSKKTMKKLVNIVAEVEKLNAGLVVPQLASTPLNDVTLTDVSIFIQGINSIDEMKKNIPSMHISGTGDFSQLKIPNLPVSLDKLAVSIDIKPNKVTVKAALPEKGITIADLGSLGNSNLMITFDFKNGLKAAPTGFDFEIAGKLVIIPLNNIAVDASIKLPPRPGIAAGAVPPSFAAMFKGIKFSDFAITALMPPGFNPAAVIPALKSTPLANITFPNMMLNALPATLPALEGPSGSLSGPQIAALTASLPPTPGINAPEPGQIAPPPVPGAPKLPLNGPASLGAGLNMFGQLPQLSFGQMIPELASTPIAGIQFKNIGFDLQKMPLNDLKKLKSGKLIPFIKIKAIADLSKLNLKIPGMPNLGAIPIEGQINSDGTLHYHTTFQAAAGLIDFTISANPLKKSFNIETSIHQTIPVPAALKQYFDFDEVEVKIDAAGSTESAKVSGIVIKPMVIKPLAKIPGVPAQMKDLEIGALQIATKATLGDSSKMSLDNAEISGLMKFPGTDVKVYTTMILNKNELGNYDIALKISEPPAKDSLAMLEKHAFDPEKAAAEITKLSQPWKIKQAIKKLDGIPFGETVFTTLNIVISTGDKPLPVGTFPDLKMPMYKGINIVGTIAQLDASLIAPQFKDAPFNGLELKNVSFVAQKIDDFANLATKLPDITLTGDADFSKMQLPQIALGVAKFKATIDPSELRFIGYFPKPIKVNPLVKDATLNVVAPLDPSKGITVPPTKVDVTIGGVASVNVPVVNEVAVKVDAGVSVNPATKKADIAFKGAVDQPKAISVATISPALASAAQGMSPELSNLMVASEYSDGVYKMDLYGTVSAFNLSVDTVVKTVTPKGGKPLITLKLMMPSSFGMQDIKQVIPQLSNIPLGTLKFNKLGMVLTSKDYEDEQLKLKMLEGVNVLGEIDEISLGALIPELGSISPINGIALKKVNFLVNSMTSIADMKKSLPAVDLSMSADLSKVPQLAKLGDVSNIPAAGKFLPDGTLKLSGDIGSDDAKVGFTISIMPKSGKFTVETSVALTIPIPGPAQTVLGFSELKTKAHTSVTEGGATVSGTIVGPAIKPFLKVPGIDPKLQNVALKSPKFMVKSSLSDIRSKKPFSELELYGIVEIDKIEFEVTLKLKKDKTGEYQTGVLFSVPPVNYDVPPINLSLMKMFNTVTDIAPVLKAASGTVTPVLQNFRDLDLEQLSVAVTQFKFTKDVRRRNKVFPLEILPYYNIIAEIKELNLGKLIKPLAGTFLNDITLSNISLLVQNITTKDALKAVIPTISVYADGDLSKLSIPNVPVHLDTADVEFDIANNRLRIAITKLENASISGVGKIVTGTFILDIGFDPTLKFKKITSFGVKINGTVIVDKISPTPMNAAIELIAPKSALVGDIQSVLKSIKPQDFAIVSMLPSDVTVAKLAGLVPGLTIPTALTSALDGLPKPDMVLAYAPTPLNPPALKAMTAGMTLPKAALASLDALSAMTRGFNLGGMLPKVDNKGISLGVLIPALKNNNMLNGIQLFDLALKGQNIPSLTLKDKNGNLAIPTLGFAGNTDLSGIAFLKNAKIPNPIPFDLLFQSGQMVMQGSLGKTLEIPGLESIGSLTNPMFKVEVDLGKRPIGVMAYVQGDVKMKIPGINVDVGARIKVVFTENDVRILGSYFVPGDIKPFEKVSSLPDQLKDLKSVDLALIEMQAGLQFTNALTSGKKVEVKSMDWMIDGKSAQPITISGLGSVSGEVVLRIIQTLKPQSKTDIITIVKPDTIDINSLVSGMPKINLDLKGCEIILNTTKYTDPDPVVGTLDPGVTFYGSYKDVKGLAYGTTLGQALPITKNTPLGPAAMNNISILVKNIAKDKQPQLDMYATLDLSKVNIPLPKLDKSVDLTKVNVHITYTEKDGLKLVAQFDQNFDITFDSKTIGTFIKPEVILEAKPKKDSKKKDSSSRSETDYYVTVKVQSDGKVNLPILGSYDVTGQFEMTKDGLQQKFLIKHDFSYKGMHLQNPYILLYETKEKQGFELHGLSFAESFGSNSKVSFKKMTEVRSVFYIMKKDETKKGKKGSKGSMKEGGFEIHYSGLFVDGKFQPFKDVVELARIPNVPDTLTNINITNAALGLHLSKGGQNAYIIGDFDLYGEPTRAGFFAIRDYLGKVGVAVLGEFVSADVNIQNIESKTVKPEIRNFYNTMVAAPVRNFFNQLPSTSLGFILNNIEYTFHIGASGIGVYPGEDTLEMEIDEGFTETGTLNTTQLIRNLDNIPGMTIPLPNGQKISVLNPRLFTNSMGPSVTYVKHLGMALDAIGLSFVVDDQHFKYTSPAFTLKAKASVKAGGKSASSSVKANNPLAGYAFDPGPFIMGYNAGIAGYLVLGMELYPPGQEDLVDFAVKGEVGVNKEEAIILGLGLTMEGMWEDAFGIKDLKFGDVAGQIDYDITKSAEEDAADEVGGSATDEVDGPTGTAAGTAAAAAEDAENAVDFGLTGAISYGDDPKTAHSGDFALNFNTEEAMDFLLMIRLWGKYGAEQIANALPYVSKAGQFLQNSYELATRVATAKPPSKLPADYVPATLPKSENYKRYQGANKNQKITSIGASMKTASSAHRKTMHAKAQRAATNEVNNDNAAIVTVADATKIIDNFATKAGPDFVSGVKWLCDETGFYAENMEFHYAAKDIEIGDLWFDLGFTCQGAAGIFGYQAGFKAQLNLDGLSVDGYFPKMDVCEALKMTNKFPQTKGQILIDGAGMDGVYGTKDDGPAFNAQLNFATKPIFVVSGEVTIVPLNLKGQGDMTIMLASGYSLKVDGKLSDWGNVTYTANMGKDVQGNPNYGASILFGTSANKALMEAVIKVLKAESLVGDTASSAAKEALDKIEATVKPLTARKVELQKEIKATEADIKKKNDAWKTNAQDTIPTLKNKIAQDKKTVDNIMAQIS